MSYAPNSEIYLLSGVPLDNTYRNTITFASKQAQTDYFKSKMLNKASGYYGAHDFSTIEPNKKLSFRCNIEEIRSVNYMMFRNTQFTSKWFYAFVTDIIYVNDNTVHIVYSVDVMQSWLFDFDILPSFVEREHVNDDTIGKHLIDEGLATGEYITNEKVNHYLNDFWIVVGATVDLTNPEFPDVGGGIYGNIYSGISYYCYNNNNNGVAIIESVIRDLAKLGKADAIVCMYMIPKSIISVLQTNNAPLIKDIRPPERISLPYTQTLNGYTPKNNKLLCYPYKCCMMSNNEGNTNILHYEFFTDNKEVSLFGGNQPNSKAIVYPMHYKGVTDNMSESICVGNFPQCAWIKDVYSNWLAQQSVREGYTLKRTFLNGAIGGVVGGVGSALMGNPIGAMAGASAVGSSLSSFTNMYMSMREERELKEIEPNAVRGSVGNGYTNIAMGRLGFTFEDKSITAEFARSIDSYLDMYGYKVNQLKVPNITGRKNWNYVRTIDVNINGNFPEKDTETIKRVLNNGITFWHTTDVGNYNLPNNIV